MEKNNVSGNGKGKDRVYFIVKIEVHDLAALEPLLWCGIKTL